MWLQHKVIVDGEIVCLRKGVFVGGFDEVCVSEQSDFGDWFVYFEMCVTVYHGLVQHIGNVCSPLQLSASMLKVFSLLKWSDTFCSFSIFVIK